MPLVKPNNDINFKAIVLLHCFARSGGTLLNKCLGVSPHTVVLSEVNPLGGGWGKRGPQSYTTVKEQAKYWFDISIKSDDFREGVLELYNFLRGKHKQLIVRDWTFINFVPHEYNNWNPPNCLLTLELLKEKCNVIPIVFIRNTIDVWISRGMPNVESFSEQYINYLNCIKKYNIKIFKYEDFCSAPKKVMREICKYSGIAYNPRFTEDHVHFTKVNGDVQKTQPSRGERHGRIELLPRRIISEEKIREVNSCKQIQLANEMNNYPAKYTQPKLKKRLWFMRHYNL